MAKFNNGYTNYKYPDGNPVRGFNAKYRNTAFDFRKELSNAKKTGNLLPVGKFQFRNGYIKGVSDSTATYRYMKAVANAELGGYKLSKEQLAILAQTPVSKHNSVIGAWLNTKKSSKKAG